jgi:glutathione S-transferase
MFKNIKIGKYMYTLIGSFTSPYVRKLRLVFVNNNISFEFKSINYLEETDSNFLKSINPLNKIPLLLIDQKPLFESRVIYNFIAKKHSINDLSIVEENLLSAIDTGMETLVNLFCLKRGGLVLDDSNSYIVRQKERVELILDYLNSYCDDLNETKSDWNYVSMSLYSFIYWANFRGMLDFSKRSNYLNFLEVFNDKKGVKETTIPN